MRSMASFDDRFEIFTYSRDFIVVRVIERRTIEIQNRVNPNRSDGEPKGLKETNRSCTEGRGLPGNVYYVHTYVHARRGSEVDERLEWG